MVSKMVKKEIHIRREGEKIIVSGDTYPIKEILKLYKLRWDPKRRVWYKDEMSEERLLEMIDILTVETVIFYKDKMYCTGLSKSEWYYASGKAAEEERYIEELLGY